MVEKEGRRAVIRLADVRDLADAAVNLMPTAMIETSDVSDAVAWLVSDEARWVTGVTLPVDAGFTVR